MSVGYNQDALFEAPYYEDERGNMRFTANDRRMGNVDPAFSDDPYTLQQRHRAEVDRKKRENEDYYYQYLNLLRTEGQLAQNRRQYDPTAIEANIRNIIGY